MAATAITLRDLSSEEALDLAASAQAFHATDGAEIVNDGETVILIQNTGAGIHIITAQTPRTIGGLAVAEKTFSVGIGDWAALPFLDPNIYNNAAGKVVLTSDGTMTEVKATAIKR